VLVSTPWQAFADLASTGTDLVDLVVAGDSLVKAARIAPEAIVEFAQRWNGRGAKVARRAARLIRAGVDSPQETRLRLLVVLAGLPEPEVNWVIWDENGHWVRRYDMCYRKYKLVLEYDGRLHAESDQQWVRTSRAVRNSTIETSASTLSAMPGCMRIQDKLWRRSSNCSRNDKCPVCPQG
jgi:hypothetical protein